MVRLAKLKVKRPHLQDSARTITGVSKVFLFGRTAVIEHANGVDMTPAKYLLDMCGLSETFD